MEDRRKPGKPRAFTIKQTGTATTVTQRNLRTVTSTPPDHHAVANRRFGRNALQRHFRVLRARAPVSDARPDGTLAADDNKRGRRQNRPLLDPSRRQK